MKRAMWAAWAVGVALVLAGSAAAQTSRPVTILRFASDAAPVTVSALEGGELTTILAWHVVHIVEGQELVLQTYRGAQWQRLLADETLPPVSDVTVTLEHPGTFAPPTFRLAVVDELDRVLDERTLVIPFADDEMQTAPEIISFATTAASINAAALAASTARVEVSWEVAQRVPLSNLVFDQVLADDRGGLVELPRRVFWVPSHGTGALAPAAVGDAAEVVLRLRVLDVISGDVYDEALLTVPVLGTAMPPSPDAAGTEPSAEAAAAPDDAQNETPEVVVPAPTTAGDLAIRTDCEALADPESRGWVDAPGVTSPNGEFIAYVSNAVGDARLVIAAENGTRQREFPAPNPRLPLGPGVRWSPAGDRIAFANIVASPPGGGYIYVLDADDFELRQVASYVGSFDDLAWSEDGSGIYFTSGVTSGSGSALRVDRYQVFRAQAEGFGAAALVAEGCAVRSGDDVD